MAWTTTSITKDDDDDDENSDYAQYANEQKNKWRQ